MPTGYGAERSHLLMRTSSATMGSVSSRSFQIRPSHPPGRRTRAISARATGASNQWKAWATTTASTAPVTTGMRSAVPPTTGTPWTVVAKTSRMEAEGSTARHLARRACSWRVSLPVPAARSRTRCGTDPGEPGQVGHRRVRIAGPGALVGVRAGLEADPTERATIGASLVPGARHGTNSLEGSAGGANRPPRRPGAPDGVPPGTREAPTPVIDSPSPGCGAIRVGGDQLASRVTAASPDPSASSGSDDRARSLPPASSTSRRRGAGQPGAAPAAAPAPTA